MFELKNITWYCSVDLLIFRWSDLQPRSLSSSAKSQQPPGFSRVADGLAVMAGASGWMNLGWWMKNSLWITKISPLVNFGWGRVVFQTIVMKCTMCRCIANWKTAGFPLVYEFCLSFWPDLICLHSPLWTFNRRIRSSCSSPFWTHFHPPSDYYC